jgi:hypothetical protein
VNAQQIRVQIMANLLAKADYETVERVSRGRNFTAAELKEMVESYGQQLVPLPAEALDDLEARPVPGRELPTFLVDMPLWTVEAGGPSELVLELELVDRYGGAYEVSVLSLRAR